MLSGIFFFYSCQTKFDYLKPLILNTNNTVSPISKLEVFGFSLLSTIEKQYFETIFS
jgi:hypothetical protein